VDCEADGPESVSFVGDAQAASNNAINTTTAPFNATCLITDPNLCLGHL